jgi:hypothetical protein
VLVWSTFLPYLVFQYRGQDVLAVPCGSKAASLAGLARYQPYTHKRRFYRLLAAALIRTGAAHRVAVERANPLGSDLHFDFSQWCAQIENQLCRRIAHAIVTWPTQSSRRRLYVHFLDPEMRSFAFAKVAFAPADHLRLATEAAALHQLARLRFEKIRVPKALHHGRFEEMSFLVMEALPEASKPMKVHPAWNSSELTAEYRGVLRAFSSSEITNLSWWAAYSRSLRPEHHAFHDELMRLLPLGAELGRAHGDLGLANMVRDGNEIWIFDWELYDSVAPALADSIGFYMSFSLLDTLRSPLTSLRQFWASFLQGSSERRRLAVMLALAFRHACGIPDATGIIEVWRETH